MPNRILKESICTSDTIEKLSWFEEVFFYRLMVNADDYGRFDARPAILRARMYPLKSSVTEKIVEQALERLEAVGLVSTYMVEDKPILQLATWGRHQQIRNIKSKYPGPECAHMISIDINCNQLQSNAPVIQSNPNRKRDSAKRMCDAFEVFWAAYPRKIAKDPARKSFTRLDPNLLPTILTALDAQKRSEQWLKEGGKFIPHPATWLNQKRWEDEATNASEGDVNWAL